MTPRAVEHDSTEENLRTLQGWLERHGRPLTLYTDKNSLFVTSRPVQWQEQLRGEPVRMQFGRALAELGIEWIAAHSPHAKGRIERLFGVLGIVPAFGCSGRGRCGTANPDDPSFRARSEI